MIHEKGTVRDYVSRCIDDNIEPLDVSSIVFRNIKLAPGQDAWRIRDYVMTLDTKQLFLGARYAKQVTGEPRKRLNMLARDFRNLYLFNDGYSRLRCLVLAHAILQTEITEQYEKEITVRREEAQRRTKDYERKPTMRDEELDYSLR